ncbi:MAG: LysE family transporter [Bacteroidales bacterium]|jgi:threonine/homoserine/homoserine lactone efflux protein
MNDFPLNLLLGMITGFLVSVPLGPAGLFCIQRTLSKGQKSGLIAGLGTASSDVIYASLAILSLSFVRNLIENNKTLLFLISGVALMVIGIAIFSSNPIKQLRQNRESKKFWEDFLTGFIMSITNPGCLFLIIGVFAFLGTSVDKSSGSIIISALLLGVFLGAALWWFLLSVFIDLFRKKFRLRQLWYINRVSGSAIMLLGLLASIKGVSLLLRILIH